MSALVTLLVALATAILGGFAALRWERGRQGSPKAAKAAGKRLVKQAEDLGRAKVDAAKAKGETAVQAAKQKAERNAKAEAAATDLRTYLAKRSNRTGTKPGGRA